MVKLGVVDICYFYVVNSDLRFFCVKDGRLFVAWFFICLRRYMSIRGKFIVEVGRRVFIGEGKFIFFIF